MTGAQRVRWEFPPSIEDLVGLADRALLTIPPLLRERAEGLAILVEDLPDDETLEDLGIEDPWDLTGLYRGRGIQRSITDVYDEPEMVVLYRLPILLEWIEDEHDLEALVRNVLLHEIGHHFGFSDEEIARLEEEG